MLLLLLLGLLCAAYSLPTPGPVPHYKACQQVLNYSPLENITSFNSTNINKVLNKMSALAQAMELLITCNNNEYFSAKCVPHPPCYSGVEDSLTEGLNASKILAKSHTLLVNLTGLLNDSIDYDDQYHEGKMAVCLRQVLRQLVDITEGLSLLRLNLNESVHSDDTDNNGPVDGDASDQQCFYQRQLPTGEQTSNPPNCRCLGIITSPQEEFDNLLEVKLGLNVAFINIKAVLQMVTG